MKNRFNTKFFLLLLIIIPIVLIIPKNAFSVEKCAAQIKFNEYLEQHPELIEETNQFNQSYNLNNQRESMLNVQIPVVVHVLYNNSIQNISDAQIFSQIDALNRDFNNLNSDKLPSGHYFYSAIGNANISFCLATTDPNGNTTTGIERKYTTQNGFDAYNSNDEDIIKKTNKGGFNLWDKTKYLNIWVVKLVDDVLGYGNFPTMPPEYDGLVIDYRAFGTTGQATFPYNNGRTAVHEIGHWLNLHHIWGDATCGNDFVNDTPKQEAANFECPATNNNVYNANSCNGATGNNGEMYMNYMDYVEDYCMNMFTNGQVSRMYATLNTYRSSFINNTSCGSVSAINNANQINVKVYPNPVVNYFYIDGLKPSNKPYKVCIYNEIGQIILQQEINSDKQEIEVSHLITGNYIVNISSELININKKMMIIH